MWAVLVVPVNSASKLAQRASRRYGTSSKHASRRLIVKMVRCTRPSQKYRLCEADGRSGRTARSCGMFLGFDTALGTPAPLHAHRRSKTSKVQIDPAVPVLQGRKLIRFLKRVKIPPISRSDGSPTSPHRPHHTDTPRSLGGPQRRISQIIASSPRPHQFAATPPTKNC